jgi:hypothetical protein
MPQPLPLCGDRLVHAPPHLAFDHPQLRLHAVPPGLPFELEFTRASFAADAILLLVMWPSTPAGRQHLA